MDERGQKLIILFGSRASGKAARSSDTDIAILGNHPLSLSEKGKLAEQIAQELIISEDAIDLVDLWDASPLLQYQVAQTGKLLHGDPFIFLRFRVLAWKRYLDTAKFRRVREQSLHAYAQRSHLKKT